MFSDGQMDICDCRVTLRLKICHQLGLNQPTDSMHSVVYLFSIRCPKECLKMHHGSIYNQIHHVKTHPLYYIIVIFCGLYLIQFQVWSKINHITYNLMMSEIMKLMSQKLLIWSWRPYFSNLINLIYFQSFYSLFINIDC